MLDPKILEQFGAKMSAMLANSPAKDIENNAKAVLSGFLSKLDLVTREEFDVQTQVAGHGVFSRGSSFFGESRNGEGADQGQGDDGFFH